MPIEDGVHGADGRGLDIAMQAPELLADLWRTPTRSLVLELNDQALDLNRQLIGMPIGPPTAISESFETTVLVALEDLIAVLARDIELATQRRHLLAVEQSRYESESLIHLVTLLPRHFAPPQ